MKKKKKRETENADAKTPTLTKRWLRIKIMLNNDLS